MRYVLKNDDGFIRWIQWTAGVVPHIRVDSFDQAMIVEDTYLDYEHERIGKTRKELLHEHHPDIQILPVRIELMNAPAESQLS